MTGLALRRPGAVIAVWLVVIGALALIGLGVEDRLTQTSLEISGSESARGEELQERHFGNSIPVAVLLKGPRDELDRQGPELVRELREVGQVRTLSPWDRGTNLEGLRPDRRSALVLADFDRPDDEAMDVVVPRSREAIEQAIDPPVESHLSGYAVIGKGLQESSIEATRRAELIAAPALLLILLFVFRSPIAALIPLAIGGATVLAGRGVISLLAETVEIDALAVSTASMMGLALGVDYALLLVSRFREELPRHANAAAAARLTSQTAGRTILFAGMTLVAAMGVAVLAAPGSLLVSVAAAVMVVALLSVAIASVAGPAVLALTGANLNRWAFGGAAAATAGAAASGWLMRALREPVVAMIAVLGLLFVLTAPAVAMETGPPNVAQLPPEHEVRQDFEEIERTAGPGWTAPFIVIATAGDGPVTEERRLRRMERWQRQTVRDDDVQAVAGPGQVSERLDPLTEASEDLSRSERQLARAESGLQELDEGLDRAVAGLDELRAGLFEAAAGAGELAAGNARAEAGARELAAGLDQAAHGAKQALAGLRAFGEGADRLAEGAQEAREGATRLEDGIGTARNQVDERLQPGAEELAEGLDEGADELGRLREPAQIAESELETAFDALQGMTIGRADPRYAEALRAVGRASAAVSGRDPVTGAPVQPGYDGLDTELARAVERLREAADGAGRLADGLDALASALGELRDGAGRLEDGLEELRDGARRLADAPRELREGIGRLVEGLYALSAGADRLASGLHELHHGAQELEAGLAEGGRQSQPLRSGLAEAGDELAPFETQISDQREQLARLNRDSPQLFDSGYFFLAALDGAPPRERRSAAQTVSLGTGGEAARFLIIPEVAAISEDAKALRDRLSDRTPELERGLGGPAAVTGGAAQLADYDEITSRQLPLLVLGLAIVTYLILIPILRALLLPLIAVLLNLLTVAAAFGVLTFLYQVLPGAPLGGPGYISAVTAAGVFGIVFGLSIDYEVFLLTRMREGYLASGDPDRAIVYGLERTAKVITGAAAIMAAVFLAFASADVASIRQFGIGLTVAVLLDATIVRLVLLPAVMRMSGRAAWWIPGWLDRLLPNLDPEPAQTQGGLAKP